MTSAKEATLSEIQQLRDLAWEEQDRCRTQFDSLRSQNIASCARVSSLRWADIQAAMQQESAEVDSDTRKKATGQIWSDTPRRKRIDQIEDKDIGGAVFFLGSNLDHLRTMKSIVAFFGRLNLHPDDAVAQLTFVLWQQQSIFAQLADEATADGDEAKAKELREAVEDAKGCFEAVFGSCKAN